MPGRGGALQPLTTGTGPRRCCQVHAAHAAGCTWVQQQLAITSCSRETVNVQVGQLLLGLQGREGLGRQEPC